MARYAVINIQVNEQGSPGKLTVEPESGTEFVITDGVWQRVWLVGDQGTETLMPQNMKFTNNTFVYDVDNVWGLNHQFSIQLSSSTGKAKAIVTGSGFKLAGNVYYRTNQNDSLAMKNET